MYVCRIKLDKLLKNSLPNYQKRQTGSQFSKYLLDFLKTYTPTLTPLGV